MRSPGRERAEKMVPRNVILKGDCVQHMSSMPESCVDVIFADPPYNLQLSNKLVRPDQTKVDGVNESWDKFDNHGSYDQFTVDWLAAAKRVLKPNGTLWVIGSYHNIFRVGSILQDLNFWLLNDVIWLKSNPMPNFRGRRFTNAHETLIWCAHSEKSKYIFNYESMKALNEDIQMRSDWLLPICNGSERLKNEHGLKAHPTQKPEALLHRVILASSNEGDLILDPFFGTGTTGAVAKQLRRNFIGIEREDDYIQVAEERLKNIRPISSEAIKQTASKKDEPRIPFGWLVERGLLRPGETLYGPSRRYAAKVTVDGSIISSDHRGSIHKIGAAVQGASACNGWTFWHLDIEGKLVPIDILRQKLRAELN